MIEKVVFIKNIGRFINCNAYGDIHFRKCNLVFAENGRGKTSFCSILRSLSTGESSFIQGRRTLGTEELPEVHLRLDGQNFIFRNNEWNNTVPHIMIFDDSFINQNVYSGENVDVDHRQNLYDIIIGERGKELASEIRNIDRDVRDKNGRLSEVRSEIRALIPEGRIGFEAFLDLPSDGEVDKRITEKDRELEAVKQSAILQRSPVLKTIIIPNMPEGFFPFLAKSFDEIAEDAEKKIASHIETHKMQDSGKEWLFEGYKHIEKDKCPFCAQDLSNSELIKSYTSFFSEAYNKLKEEIKILEERILEDFGEVRIASLVTSLDKNKAALEFWRRYSDLKEPVFSDSENLKDYISQVRDIAQELLIQKSQTPIEKIEPDPEQNMHFTKLSSYIEGVETYNKGVTEANSIIQEMKEKTRSRNLRDVEAEMIQLKSVKKRHESEVATICENYRRLLTEKRALETSKIRTRALLDTHTDEVIEQYENAINRYLDYFNAGFQIARTNYDYMGGTPNAHYKILINRTHVDPGNSSSPISEPSFRNTLSSGDRSALALAFFLAQLENNPDKAQKIVIFDDPFNSQDDFRKGNTAHRIRQCARECTQVIVLSHDKHFLKHVWDELPREERKSIQFFRVSEDCTDIAEWDIDTAVQARFKADIITLLKYYGSNEGDSRDVVTKIRPVLEGFCRNLYPTKFSETDTLGVIVEKIQEEGSGFPLHSIHEELEEINIYSRRYHHSDNPEFATEPINDAELKGYIKRTLAVTGYF